MAEDFEITGKAEQQLRNLAKALDEAGDVELRKALHSALRKSVREHAPVAAEALAANLPNRMKPMGLRIKQSVSVNASRDPGVTVAVKYVPHGRGLGARNAVLVNKTGAIRHKVFGRNEWVQQEVGGEGWFDRSWTGLAPTIRAELERYMEQLENDIVRAADTGQKITNPARNEATGPLEIGGI